MTLSLKQVFEVVGEESVVECSLTFEGEDAAQNGLSGPIAVKGSVLNRAGVVTFTYQASTELHLLCDRCLTEMTELFQPVFTHVLVRSLNQAEEGDEYVLVENDTLDLTELVYADLFLALPSKHICKEDCKGLCPICGQNLNERVCDCKPVQGDPRLEILKKLL